MRKIYIVIALLSLLAGSSFAGYWKMEGHLPQGAIDDMAVTGLSYAGNTMIAVIGGNKMGSGINNVYYYDIANQLWHDAAWGVPQYPHPVYGLAAVTVNDSIYPNGGYLQDLISRGDTTYYQVWASGWYPVPGLVMQNPRMNHGLVAIGHDLYAVGGELAGGMCDSTVEILRLNGGTVSGATPMPQSRNEAVVAKALGADGEEHIYVIGGRTNSGLLLNSVVEYDTGGVGGFWNGKTSMPGPGRWMATGAVLNNKIYVMGGVIDLAGNVTRRVDIYDPVNNSWSLGDSLPLSIIRAGAWGVNNVIYFFGGFDKGANAQTDSVWVYHPLAPNPPLLTQPQPDAKLNTQTVNFFWRKIPGAGNYRIQISKDPNFTIVDVYETTTPDTNTIGLGIYLGSENDYFWRVKSYDWSVPDSSLWSQPRRLTIDLTQPEKPIPSTPMDGSFTNNMTIGFTWFPVDSIMSYHLQVFKGDTFTTVVNNYDLGNAYANINLGSYGEGLYYWRVEAKDSAGNFSGYHSIQSFTIDQTAPWVTYTDPTSGELSVEINRDIVIGFSEPINHAIAGNFTFSCSPDPMGWFEYWNASGDTVVLSHNDFGGGKSVSFTVVDAKDLAGNNLASSYNWNFQTNLNDVTPPVIGQPSTNLDQLYAGTNAEFKVNIYDDKQVKNATLYWLPAGSISATPEQFPLTYNSGSGLYTAYLPADRIYPRGVQYQITAEDSAGNSATWPSPGEYFIHSVLFPGGGLQTTLVHDQWQMISVPTDATYQNMYNLLANELGPYDKTKWRLFIWQYGSYNELNDPSNNLSIIHKLGQAFWVRDRVSENFINFETPDSSVGGFKQTEGLLLPLDPGWNDVGTPFMYPIDWMSVEIPSMVAGPYFYDPGQKLWMNPNETVNIIDFQPYKGFSFRNDNGFSVNMKVYPLAAYKGQAKKVTMVPNAWQAMVRIETDGGADQNYFGISSDASVQRDRYDYPEPPAGLTGASGYFRLAGDQFCTDIRPELGDGQTWDFAVDCSSQTKVNVVLPAEFPAGTECYLADLTRQVSIDLRANPSYSFIPEPGEKTREFKIVAGKSDYTKAVLGSSFALPTATMLMQNRPNPFRGSTEISYQLSASGQTSLRIYNVSGQLVRTLVDRPQMAGRYTVRWDGRDDQGRSSANGVYFYRLNAGGTTASRQLVIVK